MYLYAEHVLDHSKFPRHKQAMARPTVSHHEVNASCGDELTVHLQIQSDRIVACGWEGGGCAISQAAMSMLSETLQGLSLHAAAQLQTQNILDLLHVPVGMRRMKCALLCLHALKNAMHVYRDEPRQGWVETIS